MYSAHRVIDFNNHAKRTAWLHRGDFEDTVPQPVDVAPEWYNTPPEASEMSELPSEDKRYIAIAHVVAVVFFAALGYGLMAVYRAFG